MIGYLEGCILTLYKRGDRNFLMMNVNGVGYEVQVPLNIFSSVHYQEVIALWIDTRIVQESSIQLYGFATLNDRDLFRILTSAPRVGPAMAIALMNLGGKEVTRAIATGDKATLSRIKGIGVKTAEAIIVQLRAKFKEFHSGSSTPTKDEAPAMPADMLSEVQDYLMALGYKKAEIAKAITSVDPEWSTMEYDRAVEYIITKAIVDLC